MQRFSPQLSKIAGEVKVNGTLRGKQENPSIAINSNLQITVAWCGEGVGDSTGVFAKQFGTGQQTTLLP